MRAREERQKGGMGMPGYKIITIGRQFGSGGHEIGQMLADRLEIPLYDHRLVSMAAEALNLREDTVRKVDESGLKMFLTNYSVGPASYMDFVNATSYMQSLNDNVYRQQAEIIKTLAGEGPCVIIGRCADYVLRDFPGCINVFICADKEDRIKRIAQRYDLTERKAAEKIRKTDRERRYYYELHTGLEWGSIESHQALLNVSLLGRDNTVRLLEMMYRA